MADEQRARRERLRATVLAHSSPPSPDPGLRPRGLLTPHVLDAWRLERLSAVQREICVWVALLVDGDPAGATDIGVTGLAKLLGHRSSSGINRPMRELGGAGWVTVERRPPLYGYIERKAVLRVGPRWAALVAGDVIPAEAVELDPSRQHLGVALGEAAEELFLGVDLLNDVVEMLADKGQVILYGPPGSGKTHFAQRLAQALSPDDDARVLVQFHPAYSYEDFFEGFRPVVNDAGNMAYRLTPGPLVRIVEDARTNPDRRHVMVIDEINRANLPRVLGELLFLLEYRNQSIRTQYRPDGRFPLPENLWFIGTMNTADRSIGLIDAAMRRRFHFVPFFPNHGPTAGLLHRWMGQHAPGQRWIADLVDAVNDQLAAEIGGDHLLIGPSHFMKRNLDTEALRRIWQYNIEPLIEDQLFGRQDAIDSFRFEAVWKRHGPDATSPGTQPGASDDAAAESQKASDDEGIEGQDGE